ncbi:MAG: SRPBCC family protein [Acidimicrobiia bacterium]|nr:SRPBCC family protein [Acidimicrobiia bacterium]
MIEMSSTVEIHRPAEEVFAFVSDMENNPRWQKGMKSCRWTSQPPIGVGSTYAQVAGFLGREIETAFEVVEFEPGERIRITSTKGTFPLDITRNVEAVSSGSCRVRAVIKGEPGGLLGVLAPVTKPLANRSIQKDYRRLKELLERAH